MVRKYEPYTALPEACRAFEFLLDPANGLDVPEEVRQQARNVNFVSEFEGKNVYFPCPFKETEAISALKALEGSIAAAIAHMRYGNQNGTIEIDLERATAFMFSAYLSTIDGLSKLNKNVRSKLKDTDLLAAQSNLYRRMSANLYETKRPGEYFHLHGSLEATTSLNMIGLEGYRPDLTDYREIIDVIESHMKKFTLEELEAMNQEKRQAGVTCFKSDDFIRTEHGKGAFSDPLWAIDTLEISTPPTPFPSLNPSKPKQALSGIKILELCRIVAGPTITRILAEYGADVLKVNGRPFPLLQAYKTNDSRNMGKHATELDLKTPEGRKQFEELLQEADVIVDGYRPGALEKLGYGPKSLMKLTNSRGKGIVYVNENCFGYHGEWASRPGWQQIADCVSGLAWEQGKFMGLDEPVVPPFPKSDYGTGCMGAIAALTGLFKRAKFGGSYHGKVSLLQYDIFLFKLGFYPEHIQEELRSTFAGPFFDLRHYDSVDEVSGRALAAMKRAYPELFNHPEKFLEAWYSEGYKAKTEVIRPVVQTVGLINGFLRPTRPNGYDQPTWEGWECSEKRFN